MWQIEDAAFRVSSKSRKEHLKGGIIDDEADTSEMVL